MQRMQILGSVWIEGALQGSASFARQRRGCDMAGNTAYRMVWGWGACCEDRRYWVCCPPNFGVKGMRQIIIPVIGDDAAEQAGIFSDTNEAKN